MRTSLTKSLFTAISLGGGISTSSCSPTLLVVTKRASLIFLTLVGLSACKVDDTGGFGAIVGGDDTSSIGETQAVKITSAFPLSTSVGINYNATQTFFVSSSSVRAGVSFVYTYTLGGAVVQTGSDATYVLNASLYSIADYELKVTVSDGFSSDEHSWTVQVNGPPVVNSYTPNAATAKTNHETDLVFTVSASDPNSDTLTYTWKFDGNDAILANSGSTGTLTPTESMIGEHIVAVDVSDGLLTTTHSWTIDVNYHYQECNNLASGEVCTHGGMASVGNGLDPATEPFNFRLSPSSINFDNLNNMLITDGTSHVVWYWNRTSSSVTRASVVVPANSMKVIAGTGVSGFTGDGGPALEAQFNFPFSAIYDSRDGNTYVSDWNNNRVRVINSAGEINTITTTITGQVCNNPGQMALHGDLLYIPCFGTHVVYTYKVNNPSIGTVTRIAGTYNTAAGAGTVGDGAPLTARFNRPQAVKLDSSGNVYIREREGCRVRVLNTQGGSISFGAISITGGQIGTIVGSNANNVCNSGGLAGSPTNAAGSINVGYGLEIGSESGGVATVIYIPSYQTDDVRVANYTGGSLSYGTMTIAHQAINRPYGDGTAGYIGEGNALLRRLNDPYDVRVDPARSEVVIADYSNLRIRNVATGHVFQRLLGRGVGRSVAWNLYTDSEIDTRQQILNAPYGVFWDSARATLYAGLTGVHRVTAIDRYGEAKTAIGTGSGGAVAAEDELPNQVFTNQPHSIVNYNSDVLLYSDRVNRCIRAWNRGTSGTTVLGVYISAGRVATVAGDPLSAAGYNGDSGVATSVRLNSPAGIAVHGTNLYISDSANHCIRRVDSSGNMTVVAGVCTNSTFGIEDQPATTVTLNSPEEIATDTSGNLYIADRANNRIRFVNLNTSPSITVGTRTVAVGNMHTVACGGAVTGDGVATTLSCSNPYGVAFRTGQFCFSTAGAHNVRCVSTTTGNTTTVFGRPPSNARGGSTFHEEQEGIAGSSAFLQAPRGLAFDTVNNILFVADYSNHLIRRIYLGPAP
jgi:hypothetical protein